MMRRHLGDGRGLAPDQLALGMFLAMPATAGEMEVRKDRKSIIQKINTHGWVLDDDADDCAIAVHAPPTNERRAT